MVYAIFTSSSYLVLKLLVSYEKNAIESLILNSLYMNFDNVHANPASYEYQFTDWETKNLEKEMGHPISLL